MDERDLNKLREDIHILIIDVNELKTIIRDQNRNIHNGIMAIFTTLIFIAIILICK